MTSGRDGLARSVQVRLARHAKEIGVDPNLLLTRYAVERFLYRLSRSTYAERFVLKGALLILVWLGETLRPTRDADLLGFGDLPDDVLLQIFRDVCEVKVEPDAMTYLTDTVRLTPIRFEDAYGGRRVTLQATTGAARLSVQVDIGVGDVVTPEPEWLEYPSLLDLPRPRLRAYPRETVIAEKLHAMVFLGSRNSRMKDYFDLHALSRDRVLDAVQLARAIAATFTRRRTPLPAGVPPGLSDEFASDARKRVQWTAFLDKNRLEGPTLDEAICRDSHVPRRADATGKKTEVEGVTGFTESVVEDATLAWLQALGYDVLHGPDIACGEPNAERGDPNYRDVVLERRLRQALRRLNQDLPDEAMDDVFRKLTRADAPSLLERNRALHRMLIDGVTVEYRRKDGSIAGAQAKIIDFDVETNNDWCAVNQFTVSEGQHTRRPDVMLFINGIPLAVIELKNSADENATVWSAFQQLQTYQAQIPALFATNAVLIASDGVQARIGSLGAGKEWFKPWRTVAGREDAPAQQPELHVMLEGVFEQRRFLDLMRYFIVFEDSAGDTGGGGTLVKKIAGYHQYHAVNVALNETLRAARTGVATRVSEPQGRYGAGLHPGGEPGDRRVGVVWHTQGAGKSLTMAFYAGRVILHPAMANPTIVVITDRNDLDDQLFGTFARCRDLLRQPPVQAVDRTDLRAKLAVAAGGVVFTTIQKFFPEAKGDQHPVLSDRHNIVVIADEAHRSQYDFIDGFARHMRDALPNASFVGFTGTPIEKTDANTRAVFGDYISVYDIQRAVFDGATVPIYYESRLAKLELRDSERPNIDPEFEEATEGEEVDRKEKLKSKWAQLEAVVGSENRVKLVARDLIEHFENRLTAMEGKAMVVAMSRRIAVALYRELVALRPAWHGDDDEQGRLKVVMTGSASDPLAWQQHIRNKKRREDMALRFRDPKDAFQIVIVRDMWLTGFDAPSLHTMYVDKPMRGHGLMQAIARVNRVFKDKPGGLVVDYLGLADELKQALATYTEAGGTGETALDQAEAVAVMLEKFEICRGLFHRFNWSRWTTGTPQDRVSLLPAAQEHILAQKDGKARLLLSVTELSRAFALAVPNEEALRIRDDVGFFQAVRAVLAKSITGERRTDEELDLAIRQIISKAVVSEGVVDIFAAAGLKKPDISILSDEFLADIRGMPHRNLAVELLQKLLKGEIRLRSRRNVVQGRSFADLLEQSVRKYQNRAIETAQVIEELIQLAKDMRAAAARGEQLGLSDDELAFYDALEANDSAVKVLGDETLRAIARELVETVRKNVTIDWTMRDNVRAQVRVLVKRILRKHGYPPDKQEKATQTVLEQAELLSEAWASV